MVPLYEYTPASKLIRTNNFNGESGMPGTRQVKR